jgi:hypothetical protein
MRHAHSLRSGIYPTDVLVDQFRLVTRRLDPRRLGDQCRHLYSSFMKAWLVARSGEVFLARTAGSVAFSTAAPGEDR